MQLDQIHWHLFQRGYWRHWSGLGDAEGQTFLQASPLRKLLLRPGTGLPEGWAWGLLSKGTGVGSQSCRVAGKLREGESWGLWGRSPRGSGLGSMRPWRRDGVEEGRGDEKAQDRTFHLLTWGKCQSLKSPRCLTSGGEVCDGAHGSSLVWPGAAAGCPKCRQPHRRGAG